MAEQDQSPPSQEDLLRNALTAHKANQQLRQNVGAQKQEAAQQVSVFEPAEAAVTSLVNGYTLGLGNYAKAAGSYLGETLANQPEVQPNFQRSLSEAQSEADALKQRNPVTSGVAGLVGSVLSPVSKVAPGSGIIRNVAQGTATSGVQGFLESRSHDLAGKLSDAESSALLGGGASTLLGTAGKAVRAFGTRSGAEKSAVKALSPSVAANAAIKSLDSKLASQGKEGIGRMLLSDQLVRAGETIYQTAERVNKARGAAGELIGDFLTTLDDQAAKAGLSMQNPAQILRDSLRPIDKLLKDNPNATQIISTIRPKINAFVESYASAKSPQMQLSNLHRFQAELGHAYDGADSVTKEALKALESGLSKKLEAEVNRISTLMGPSTQATYQGLKTRFNMLSLAKDAVEGGASRAEAAQSNVMSKTLWRLPAVIGTLSGHPESAPAAFAPEVIQLARERAGSTIAATRNVFASPAALNAIHGTERAARGSILETLRELTGK